MMKKLYLILLAVLLTVPLQAQIQYKKINKEPENYNDIIIRERQHFDKLKAQGQWGRKEQKAYKQFERWAYIWKDRINPDGSFPVKKQMMDKDEWIQLLLHKDAKRNSDDFSNNTWSLVGPDSNVNQNNYSAYPGMGRINVVAVAPNNSNLMIAGASAGGIWKTTNGGNTWTPIGDDFAGMGVTDILIDPNNSNIIYVATGDEDGQHITSIGVFKSTDGGNTWNPTGLVFSLANFQFIRDLAFFPGNSQKIFALTNNEIKISTNGGTTWSNANVSYAPYQPFTAYFQTIIFDPDNPNKVIVSDVYGGIYVSTNGGNSFALHQTYTGGNSGAPLKLTSTPNDTNNFYGLDYVGNFYKFRYDMDGSSNDLVASSTVNGFNSQGGYNIAIAVSPTNKNNIIVGGVKGYISTDNGQSFSVKLNPYNNPPGVGFYVHPDHHHLSFLSDGVTVIDGHDGGIHKGGFSANSWTDISNGLVITQSYNIAITQENNGDNFIMANQDNDGFSKVVKNGVRQWVAVAAGDGTSAGIDYSNPNIRYLGGTNGALYRTSDGFSSGAFSGTQILSPSGNASFVSPMEVHPTTPSTIYAARGDIYKSTDYGNSWNGLSCGAYPVTFINVTPYNGNTHICIVGNGTGKHSTNDGQSWQSLNLPGGYQINSLIAKPNSNTLYATVPGYFQDKVIKSTDGGNTWSNISSGLPNIAMKRIVLKTDENNETLFVGTELGVYWKNNTMSSWQKLGQGLPNVIVNDLRINYADQELYVGTFGRSMWKISVDNSNNIAFDENEKPVIYPNPVTDHIINVKVNENLLSQGSLKYIIYNVIGGIIAEGTINSEQSFIKLDSRVKGLNMIKITDGNKTLVQKLIVK
jgi:photosystem II stability/assembly factor-like uncharacterized protein